MDNMPKFHTNLDMQTTICQSSTQI